MQEGFSWPDAGSSLAGKKRVGAADDKTHDKDSKLEEPARWGGCFSRPPGPAERRCFLPDQVGDCSGSWPLFPPRASPPYGLQLRELDV
jgi:hypothetical protein